MFICVASLLSSLAIARVILDIQTQFALSSLEKAWLGHDGLFFNLVGRNYPTYAIWIFVLVFLVVQLILVLVAPLLHEVPAK